ncbi:OmpA family protein [Hymenobacter psychrotolerans]|uniref:Outer membrane protein OmpA n=1 Tax=Hymenobacter psychrotolerans DSM 18569 TaxID=1121959 RepID=A0A1M6VA03_9BACT|nr:OmpA family protein [Hymenobacter psychrotolerans]SHK78278.1 Outer membrane protein OmpA [Hymenobacter psychrotolerans DSM 18569]
MKYFITFALLFCCTLLNAVAEQLQATTNIVGTVRSADNQVLVKASIVVVHVPSGTQKTTTTDAAGNFAVDQLTIGGPYMVQVSQPRYQTATINDIFLLNGKTASGTFVLRPEEKRAASKKERALQAAVAENAAPAPAAGTTGVSSGPTRYHLTYIQQCQMMPAPGAKSVPVASPSAPRAMPASAPTASVSAAVPAEVSATSKGTALPLAAARPAGAAAPVAVAGRGPVPAPSPATAAPAAATKPAAYSGPDRSFTPNRYPARKPANRITPPVVPGHYDAKTGNYIYQTGAPTTLQLANGRKLAGVGINSTESLLHRFLTNPKAQIDTVDLTQGWMSFDRVFFDSGKATLTKESMAQLRHIVALLQAYPNARLKLGGYTDSTGTYKVNRQLSDARARTAWAALVEMGVSPARLDARGYGSNYPVATNTTEEGRAMNRRLSLKVLQK